MFELWITMSFLVVFRFKLQGLLLWSVKRICWNEMKLLSAVVQVH